MDLALVVIIVKAPRASQAEWARIQVAIEEEPITLDHVDSKSLKKYTKDQKFIELG